MTVHQRSLPSPDGPGAGPSMRARASTWRTRFDTRTAMVIISASGAVPLLVIALISPTFLKPNALPLLMAVLSFTAVTVAFAAQVGRLSEVQFAALGFGGMAGVAISAHLIADPAGTRAVTAMLAIVPAIAASESPPRVTAALTAISMAMATALSVTSLSSSGWAVTAIAIGAAVTAVLVPVVLITSLRCALAAVNDKLHVLASTDPLTGLQNRRGLLARAETLLDTATERGRAVSALVVDIDLFKTVNDTDGHAAGDRALTSVARALTRAVDAIGEPAAVVARIGGEEFLILAPHESEIDLAERVLHRIRSDCTVTVSIGSITLDLHRPTSARPGNSNGDGNGRRVSHDIDEVVHAADIALYEAKNTGRDRACHGGTLTLE
ncbi:GGDEF domain-containing protein [Rhodococcoides kyotonense]|uniref:GGDEF domain-containing protein n=1 Tax=Rhodococcoides kyotonense TaxID=398843 RepID=UPI000AD53A0A|nr:GGDEF domain-containing protein [Rhodococcus kyotonensis]